MWKTSINHRAVAAKRTCDRKLTKKYHKYYSVYSVTMNHLRWSLLFQSRPEIACTWTSHARTILHKQIKKKCGQKVCSSEKWSATLSSDCADNVEPLSLNVTQKSTLNVGKCVCWWIDSLCWNFSTDYGVRFHLFSFTNLAFVLFNAIEFVVSLYLALNPFWCRLKFKFVYLNLYYKWMREFKFDSFTRRNDS